MRHMDYRPGWPDNAGNVKLFILLSGLGDWEAVCSQLQQGGAVHVQSVGLIETL